MNIRIEKVDDYEAITRVTEAAFRDHPYSHQSEHLIVQALREDKAMALSLVAEEGGEVVGHIAFSKVLIDGQDVGWYGIGPLSVKPEMQRQGIGSQMMELGLEVMRQRGAQGCALVGDPAYYQRFGFQANPDLVLPEVPPENFMVLSFNKDLPAGEVCFHRAFTL